MPFTCPAARWRQGYYHYVGSFASGKSTAKWVKIDDYHREELEKLAKEYTIPWTRQELDHISKIWHKLDPHVDAVEGMLALRKAGFITSTLSNGNFSLLVGPFGFPTTSQTILTTNP